MNPLNHNLLIMQQITSMLANDFTIADETGAVVGHVIGTDNAGSRFFLGTREFNLLAADGTLLAHISDPPDFGFDTFQVIRPDGSPIARVQNQLSIITRRFSIQPVDGRPLEVRGQPFSFSYDILLADTGIPVARVSREWAGLSHGLLGHSRYVLSIAPDSSRDRRLSIICGVIALDLMRAKDNT